MKRGVAPALMVAIALLGAAYAGSPYWTAWSIESAAAAGDGERLAAYVDFPSMRDSIRSQVQALLLRKIDSDAVRNNPLTGLGLALAGSVVDRLVDAFITGDNLARIINRGHAALPVPDALASRDAPVASDAPASRDAPVASDAPASAPSPTPAPATATALRPRITCGYRKLNVFDCDVHASDTGKRALTLELGREGPFGWRIKAMRFAALDR